jgi:hypothetical protein
MSLGDRLGVAGLIVALIAVATTYLWPDKKWIGWLSLAVAGILVIAWGVFETEAKLGSTLMSLGAAIAIGGVAGVTVAILIWNSSRIEPVKGAATAPTLGATPEPPSSTTPVSHGENSPGGKGTRFSDHVETKVRRARWNDRGLIFDVVDQTFDHTARNKYTLHMNVSAENVIHAPVKIRVHFNQNISDADVTPKLENLQTIVDLTTVEISFAGEQKADSVLSLLVTADAELSPLKAEWWGVESAEPTNTFSPTKASILRGLLVNFSTGTEKGQTVVVVGGHITNPNGPPTGTVDWHMNVEFNDGTVAHGVAPLDSADDIPMNDLAGKPTARLLAADWFPLKTSQPIPTGGIVIGWYRSIFTDISTQELVTGKAVAAVEFTEVATGKKHIMRRDISAPGLWIAPNLPR